MRKMSSTYINYDTKTYGMVIYIVRTHIAIKYWNIECHKI